MSSSEDFIHVTNHILNQPRSMRIFPRFLTRSGQRHNVIIIVTPNGVLTKNQWKYGRRILNDTHCTRWFKNIKTKNVMSETRFKSFCVIFNLLTSKWLLCCTLLFVQISFRVQGTDLTGCRFSFENRKKDITVCRIEIKKGVVYFYISTLVIGIVSEDVILLAE
jgi:hypothetical protein